MDFHPESEVYFYRLVDFRTGLSSSAHMQANQSISVLPFIESKFIDAAFVMHKKYQAKI